MMWQRPLDGSGFAGERFVASAAATYAPQSTYLMQMCHVLSVRDR